MENNFFWISSIKTYLTFIYQCVIAASKSGFIYIWDLRGGRSPVAFQSHKEVLFLILLSFDSNIQYE